MESLSWASSSDEADRPLLVLVVDDDAAMRDYVRGCLAPLTTHVLEASDGVQALELARSAVSEHLRVVIADIRMPRMDGIALREAMMSDPSLAPVRLLLITGDASLGEIPGVPILRKPFNARVLQASVKALLETG